MEQYLAIIKQWLGTGSINIFGLPFSGKDTVGVRLAELLGARLLSSGLILRSAGDKELLKDLAAGVLAPTSKFQDLVLPYLKREDLRDYPLILSSVGRWEGEEYDVIAAANDGGHPIKAVLLLNVSEAEVKNRWEAARMLQDRGQRQDDHDLEILEVRIKEFIEKTMPVIETYRKRDLLVPITANKDRDTVLYNAIVGLYDMAMREQGKEIPPEQ